MLSLLYIPTKNKKEAKKIARLLLDERLIACANIVPRIESLYSWKGEIQVETETLLLLKTQTTLVKRVIARVKEIHSYTVPCIEAISITDRNAEYEKWVKKVMK